MHEQAREVSKPAKIVSAKRKSCEEKQKDNQTVYNDSG
jgi:hypothetical protein